jgi:glycosyltransferase involved in cell wall biosynthesis
MARVSVILSSYNHGSTIGESIESVLNQIYTDFELIVWDDASSDDSWEIINSYKDERIRVFQNKENMRGGNINRALEIVTGKYIAIHHSDDVWKPEKLQKQVAYLDAHSEIGAVFTHVQIIDEHGEDFTDTNHPYSKIFDQSNRNRHEWLRFFFTQGNALCHPSVLIRKRCFEECGLYRYGLVQLPDFDLWIRLCLKFDIYIIQEKLTKFRIREKDENCSGNRIDTRIRANFEYYHVLSNYLTISDFQELCKIFPEAEKYYRQERMNLRFILAMISLELELQAFPITKFFGLNILFDLIQQPKVALQLRTDYKFDLNNFVRLTGIYDIFSINALRERDDQIISLFKTVEDLNKQIAKLKSQNGNEISINKIYHFLSQDIPNKFSYIFEKLSYRKWSEYQSLKSQIKGTLLLDNKWYSTQYHNIKLAKLCPICDYCYFGVEEGRNPNPYFDTKWYLYKYPEVEISGANPLLHYLKYGVQEGKNPNPKFDTKLYLSKYPDVEKSGVNPLLHYLQHGGEGFLSSNSGKIKI